jgi:hypothetical protein
LGWAMLRYAVRRRACVRIKPSECETSKPPAMSIEAMSALYSVLGEERPVGFRFRFRV